MFARAVQTGSIDNPLANSTTRKSINVLIVDDEETQRVPLAAMLDAWGYKAEMAGDGQEALE